MLRGAKLRQRRCHRLAIVACKAGGHDRLQSVRRKRPRSACAGGRGGEIMARTSQKRSDGVLLLTKLALECAKIRLAAARRGRNERADGVHRASSSAISRGTAEELDVDARA